MQSRIGWRSLGVTFTAAMLAIATADIPNSAVSTQFGSCTLMRTMLVSTQPHGCESVPHQLLQSTLRLYIEPSRNSSQVLNQGPSHKSGYLPRGQSYVSAEYPAWSTELYGNDGPYHPYQPSPVNFFQAGNNMGLRPFAKITRSSCPVSSFAEAFMSTYTNVNKVFPYSGQSSLVPLQLEGGDALPAGADVVMKLPRFMNSAGYWMVQDYPCTARYKVTRGQCMFSGVAGQEPVCPFGPGPHGTSSGSDTSTVTQTWSLAEGVVFEKTDLTM